MAHPPLSAHLHAPDCVQLIFELDKCHQERSFAKFFGACNAMRRALDNCLQDEFEVLRQKKLAEARAKTEKWNEYRRQYRPRTKQELEHERQRASAAPPSSTASPDPSQ